MITDGLCLRSADQWGCDPIAAGLVQLLNGFDATSEAQSEKAVTVATRRNGRFAEISVADTGPGVSEDSPAPGADIRPRRRQRGVPRPLGLRAERGLARRAARHERPGAFRPMSRKLRVPNPDGPTKLDGIKASAAAGDCAAALRAAARFPGLLFV